MELSEKIFLSIAALECLQDLEKSDMSAMGEAKLHISST